MRANRSAAKKHVQHHKDGTVRAKGQTLGGAATGYREWFRRDATRMRSGLSEQGQPIEVWTT